MSKPEKPTIFNATMVRAILHGRKTQTRRLMSERERIGYPSSEIASVTNSSFTTVGNLSFNLRSPYQPGDLLWVRETWGCPSADHPRIKDGRKPTQGDRIVYRANDADAWQWDRATGGSFCWRPAIHMPRWASRLTLEVLKVRPEWLRGISGEDAIAEGIQIPRCDCEVCATSAFMCPADASDAILAFAELWDGIYGKGYDKCWDANPLVWVVEFKVVQS